jgi:uncharacterized peroxidase-related enzyme
MSRINTINTDEASGKTKTLLDAVQSKLGITPNSMKTMAQSPEVLEAYLGFSGAIGSSLTATLREQIALVSAEENGCGYCAAAHTALGKLAGLTEKQTLEARLAASEDVKTDAALKFAKIVIEKRGRVSDADLNSVRDAGYTDGNLAEIVAHVALNIFTNYFNEVGQVEIDFPKVDVPLRRTAQA